MDKGSPIDETVQALAQVHADRLQSIPRNQVGIERLIDWLGRPWFAFFLPLSIIAWIGLSALLAARGLRAFDRPEYPWLQLTIGIGSLVMTALILISSNRQGDMDDRRAQVTLQFALVIEQKVSKIIETLDAMREDNPKMPGEVDYLEEMSKPTDVREAIDQVENAQGKALQDRRLPTP
jgi:uncharacterized membrane protein